jgi:hypothetical protein
MIYLLLRLIWGLLCIVIFTRHPEAFSFGTSPGVGEQPVFPILLYFSLTTLSTVGFGDITPLTLVEAHPAATTSANRYGTMVAILLSSLSSGAPWAVRLFMDDPPFHCWGSSSLAWGLWATDSPRCCSIRTSDSILCDRGRTGQDVVGPTLTRKVTATTTSQSLLWNP